MTPRTIQPVDMAKTPDETTNAGSLDQNTRVRQPAANWGFRWSEAGEDKFICARPSAQLRTGAGT